MKKLISLLILPLLFLFTLAQAADYQIGVYYFPGWKNRQAGAQFPLPWEKIKPYPEREPKLGWYVEGTDAIVQQQIDWMNQYSIDYIAYDWYWGKDNRAYLEHALAAYLKAPNKGKVKFSLLWANGNDVPASQENFQRMVAYWVKYYMQRPEYFRIDNKPVVIIFSADFLKNAASRLRTTSKEMLDSAQAIAVKAGLPGIHFVAGAWTSRPMIDSYANNSGYKSFSAYNYHQGPFSPVESHSYAELDQGYREHWKRFATLGNLPFIVPMTSGWDRRPWGGSKDSLHDQSKSTPEEFELHLQAAKELMDNYPVKTKRMGIICCWNEFGEGSYIEPTKAQGFSYLEKIQKVFGGGVP